MCFNKKFNCGILVAVIILVTIFGVIWILPPKMDAGLSTERQKQENPVVPQNDAFASAGVNPDDFREVILDSRSDYYVKAGGKITFLSDMSSEIAVVVHPGTSRYEAQTLPKDPQNKMVYGNYGDYGYTFSAPLIPGVYRGVIVTRTNNSDGKRPENKNFKLTVINEIKSEAEAYTVAEYFLHTKIFTVEDATIKGWTLQKRDIILTDEGWKVSLEFVYQSCGIDWRENVCGPRSENATFLVRKNGLIEQIQ